MIVRKNSLVVLFFMILSLPVVGQIRIGIECDNSKFMIGEAIMAKIAVNSEVEVPLVFNKSYNNAELEICVTRDRAAAQIPLIEDLGREFVLMPNESEIELVDVSSLMSLYKEGSYQINARVKYDDLIYTSKAQGVDIVRGIELMSIKRSLSGYSKKILNYSFRYLARNMSECAFLVVTDENNCESYGTIRLGSLVRVMEPSMKFDKDGRIVIVHQSGRNRFTRSVIRVHRDGSEFVEQTHHKRNGSLFRN